MSTTSNSTILALDAAAGACSAALWAGGAIAQRRWEAMERGHAEALMPMARDVVADTGFQGLDLVAVSVGPGGYTGLRIAIAAARGLGLALGVPVMGVGSLDVHRYIARNDGVTGPMGVLLETKRADLYFQAFGSGDDPLMEPSVASGAEVEERLVSLADLSNGAATLVGDAVERFVAQATHHLPDQLVTRIQAADAAAVAALAASAFAESGGADISPPRPMYLRAPDTSPPAADRQRLRG
ncbi:MAG: tRNA (adenosine(37)-N6)-threonylcarbamoyltransferase complex dimerization subunit type 1 TsaB [Rhodospirillaceae bacterium]|jgi:tRNA threonylcarbamoyladenosine biosynthesis protein TsaB|nr:tRNA (adenosine(37)-N6)-threonylcarbamoyltransferase complex dimerization subunit type 1 TsaB [Rhodospirillaceae bacterium]MBT6404086.1 tRNA (adenosine(37)-N6)-threonylcarbamoyltransferase complex dimerization subunit type 1 TsaB [Rhodospirillaceae bacterium]MBT6536973.1 tRNA (adenosine(37)-N6)-threonylcarbamoyltransferase complex dimerization subunit type 1 TsaB [Rhodospirillaceae bacterium]MBT7361016.1 tRNA (adenosine(37)-N6)-threonylcarbamoyltransferase complex dimerization subunit type 1 